MAVEVTRLFVMVVLFVAAVFGFCACAPAVGEETLYDQRQNGTENFRLHINDVVIVHAPLEALLASVSGETPLQEQLMDFFSGASSTAGNDLLHPSTEAVTASASTSGEIKTPAGQGSTSAATSADTTTGQPQGQSDKPLKTR
jgi:hypothetical protein